MHFFLILIIYQFLFYLQMVYNDADFLFYHNFWVRSSCEDCSWISLLGKSFAVAGDREVIALEL